MMQKMKKWVVVLLVASLLCAPVAMVQVNAADSRGSILLGTSGMLCKTYGQSCPTEEERKVDYILLQFFFFIS